MESGNCSTCYGNEHKAPDRLSYRMHVSEMRPYLRNRIIRIRENTNDNTDCHNDQADTEQWIDTSDDLID